MKTLKLSGRISYAYPPFQGTHQDNYTKINNDSEIVPAEGLHLSLLTQGAFSFEGLDLPDDIKAMWAYVRDTCIIENYIRIPKRNNWIPKKHELAGVFVERDLQGKGLSERMKVPENINGWKKQGNLYVKDNMIFVPEGNYKLGEHNQNTFPEDGFAIALLTEEGAEIFAKTAYDNNLVPYTLGVNINNINSPEQKVAYVNADRDRLNLNGDGHGHYTNGFSFGIALITNFSL